MTVRDVEPALDISSSFSLVLQDKRMTHQPTMEQHLLDLLDLEDPQLTTTAETFIRAAKQCNPATEVFYLRAAVMSLAGRE